MLKCDFRKDERNDLEANPRFNRGSSSRPGSGDVDHLNFSFNALGSTPQLAGNGVEPLEIVKNSTGEVAWTWGIEMRSCRSHLGEMAGRGNDMM